jgi:hypothetical protein
MLSINWNMRCGVTDSLRHFESILSLSRAALSDQQDQVRFQLERLRSALEQEGESRDAGKLARLRSRDEKTQTLEPMSLDRMRSESVWRGLPGEALTRKTPLPPDKDTATPLVRVVFPEDLPVGKPVLNDVFAAALDDLIGEWERLEELGRLGVEPNLRCLLYGAPGVGKTLLARHIACRLGLPIVEARLDGLVSSFLGTTARNIGALFDFANRYKCILFLDEFDAVAKARDDVHEVGEIKRVVNTLLQSLDARGQKGITLAATNHAHLLDRAVWRRFDSRIEIPMPDEASRVTLLERFVVPLELEPGEIQMLGWLTEGMSGADIETLVNGGKRYFALHGNGDFSDTGRRRSQAFLSALRRQAMLNAHAFEDTRRNVLLGDTDELLDVLVDQAGLSQSAAGRILGLSQSSVSRRKRQSEAGTGQYDAA